MSPDLISISRSPTKPVVVVTSLLQQNSKTIASLVINRVNSNNSFQSLNPHLSVTVVFFQIIWQIIVGQCRILLYMSRRDFLPEFENQDRADMILIYPTDLIGPVSRCWTVITLRLRYSFLFRIF